MVVARFQLPDGRIARFEVAEGTTPEQAQAEIERHLATLPRPQAAPAVVPSQSQPDEAEAIAGSPITRFALGAASPILGAAQLGAEAVGAAGVTEHLKRLEQMKRRGMTPAAELQQLKDSRERLAKLPGYEAAIAAIDRQIAELGTAPSADPSQAGVDVAGIAGTVISPAVLGAMKIPAAGSVLGRAGQGAGLGTAFGLASPVTEGDDFWTAKAAQAGTGALIGGIVPPGIEAGTKVYRVARNMLDPLLPGGVERGASRLLAEAAATKRPQIEAELAANRILVPGSQPTAAEAAAPAGSAEFSAMQRIAAERQPTAYSDIAKAQEQARRASIQSFAKDKSAVEGAIAARGTEATKNYGAVRGTLLKMDKELESLIERPSMAKALSRAQELASEAGEVFEVGGHYPVQSLHYVKMALDDMIATPERFGIGASEVRAIGNTKKLFTAWLENRAPLYEKARSAYAAMSKPINEMQVGQELERALVKPIGEGERSGVFAGAMREAPRTIKKATGQPRFEELDEVLQPENLKKARDILADLARKAEQTRLSAAGRSKASEIAQAFTLPASGPLNQQYMVFKTILGRISKGVTEKTLDNVAEALKIPSTTLKLLQRAPTQYQQKLIDQIIAQKLGRGAIAAATELSGEAVQQ